MDDDERRELTASMFALLTAKFEDGAAIAADGQGKDVADEVRSGLADRLRSIGSEIVILADVVALISNREPC